MASCDKCYDNNFFKYTLSNNKCSNNNGINNKNTKTKFIYERIDGYIKKEQTINFKIHFILLNNYLSGAILDITAKITRNNLLRDIRHLDTESLVNFNCTQYGDVFGNINKDKGGYLINFLCSIDYQDNDISSIKFETIKINKDNVNKDQLDNIKNKDFKINEISKDSLDEVYKDYYFNKITVKKVTDAILTNELTFNIVADFDSQTHHERIYEIKLNTETGGTISAICTVPITNNLVDEKISCYSPEENVNQKLSFVQGVYASKEDSSTQLIVIDNDVTIEVTIGENKKKRLPFLAIAGITIAGIFIVGPFIFYLLKYFLEKKENYYDGSNVRRKYDGNNSKEIIYY
jgi:hypothetical protein